VYSAECNAILPIYRNILNIENPKICKRLEKFHVIVPPESWKDKAMAKHQRYEDLKELSVLSVS